MLVDEVGLVGGTQEDASYCTGKLPAPSLRRAGGRGQCASVCQGWRSRVRCANTPLPQNPRTVRLQNPAPQNPVTPKPLFGFSGFRGVRVDFWEGEVKQRQGLFSASPRPRSLNKEAIARTSALSASTSLDVSNHWQQRQQFSCCLCSLRFGTSTPSNPLAWGLEGLGERSLLVCFSLPLTVALATDRGIVRTTSTGSSSEVFGDHTQLLPQYPKTPKPLLGFRGFGTPALPQREVTLAARRSERGDSGLTSFGAS